MRKSAQTFLRRAALTTRAMRACRVAGSCRIAPLRHDLHARGRHTATRTTALAHLHAKSPTRPPAMPCTVVPTGTARRGDRLAPARTAPSCIGEASSAHRIGDARASPTRVVPPCRAAPAPRRKAGAGRRAGRRHRSPPDATNTLRSRYARRRPHMVFAATHAATQATRVPGSPCREWRCRRANAGELAEPRPKRNRPHWAAGSGIAMGGRLSGRRPRAVRRTRPATAVRSTARHRPLPAPGSSLRRRRPR
ncbi:hypothetical protein NB721_002464 [Xanthomonas sacchari]|nr:hypothetical protein [Xanthomonas sacchari]